MARLDSSKRNSRPANTASQPPLATTESDLPGYVTTSGVVYRSQPCLNRLPQHEPVGVVEGGRILDDLAVDALVEAVIGELVSLEPGDGAEAEIAGA